MAPPSQHIHGLRHHHAVHHDHEAHEITGNGATEDHPHAIRGVSVRDRRCDSPPATQPQHCEARTCACQELLDAQEVLREWHLRCVQTEAELRALQGCSAEEDNHEDDNKAAICAKGVGNGGVPFSEAQRILSQVLALERHVVELQVWRGSVEQEVSVALARAEALEVRLPDERACADVVGVKAGVTYARTKELIISRELEQSRSEEACNKLWLEGQRFVDEARSLEATLPELEDAASTQDQLSVGVSEVQAETEGVEQARERLWMRREELRNRRHDFIDSHARSVRATALARKLVQARNGALHRLHGELSLARSKNDRNRRQAKGLLEQCRGELADSVARADSAVERLCKVKQQHGKEVRCLRVTAVGLQTEVDQHLQSIETSDAEVDRLCNQEVELESERRRHFDEEVLLEDQARRLRMEAQRLEIEVSGVKHAECSSARERLYTKEMELAEALRDNSRLEEELPRIWVRIEKTEAASRELSTELEEEHSACGIACEEAARLCKLEEHVAELQEKNVGLVERHTQWQESTKQAQKRHDRHVSDMHEAVRRAARLKSQHDELFEALRTAKSKGCEGLIVAMEPVMGRVNKKVDALTSCLDILVSGPKKISNSDSWLEIDVSSTSQRGQVTLQRRLQAEREREMEALLAAERQKVLVEQQRSLDDAKRRGFEMQKAMNERRHVEVELARCQQALELARQSAQSELEGFRAQVRLVDREALEGAEAVTAEYSDLLQKQALQRNAMQVQVNELRREVEEERAYQPTWATSCRGSLLVEPDGEYWEQKHVPSDLLMQRLASADAEAEALRREEEELSHAHVRLKAAFIAMQQHGERRPIEGPRRLAAESTGRCGTKTASRGNGSVRSLASTSASPRQHTQSTSRSSANTSGSSTNVPPSVPVVQVGVQLSASTQSISTHLSSTSGSVANFSGSQVPGGEGSGGQLGQAVSVPLRIPLDTVETRKGISQASGGRCSTIGGGAGGSGGGAARAEVLDVALTTCAQVDVGVTGAGGGVPLGGNMYTWPQWRESPEDRRVVHDDIPRTLG